MTQPTYIVHHEQLKSAEQRARWCGLAAPVLVLATPAAPCVPLEAWLEHQAPQGGTG